MNAWLIVLSFLLMPILIIGFFRIIEDRRKRAVRSFLEKALDQFTKQNELFIAEIEFFRNKVIGIDRKNKKLVYADYRKDAVGPFCIDLNLLAFCRIIKTIDNDSNDVKEILIEVRCTGINKIFRLTFYDRLFDDIRAKALLLRKAEHWKNKI